MADYVASQIVKLMIKRDFCKWRPLLMLGITFKENCPDVRTLRSINQVWYDYGITIKPMILADPDAVFKEYGIQHVLHCQALFDAVVLE
jgi:UDP-N-acetyl-D-galactosamine dehydrogenase